MPVSWTEAGVPVPARPNFPGFKQVAAYRPDDVTLELPAVRMRLMPGIAVSAELFDVLGASPGSDGPSKPAKMRRAPSRRWSSATRCGRSLGRRSVDRREAVADWRHHRARSSA